VAAANTVYLGSQPGRLVRKEEDLQAAAARFQAVSAICDELASRLRLHPDLAGALTAYRDGLLAWFTEQGAPDISQIQATAAAYDEVSGRDDGLPHLPLGRARHAPPPRADRR
jgi:hypothetical protein